MKRLFAFICLTAAAALLGCDGFKEAMSGAHRCGRQGRLAGALRRAALRPARRKAKVPVTKEVAKTITEPLGHYQLLGEAAAHGDSLADTKVIDKAMWPLIAQARASKWHDQIAKSYPALDTAGAEAKFNAGEVFAASHILFLVPPTATPTQRDSIKKKADGLHAQATAANFAKLAAANSKTLIGPQRRRVSASSPRASW